MSLATIAQRIFSPAAHSLQATAAKGTEQPSAPMPATEQYVAGTETETPAAAPRVNQAGRLVYTVGAAITASQIGICAFGPLGVAAAYIGVRHGMANGKQMSVKNALIITGATIALGTAGHFLGGPMGQACGTGLGFVLGESLTRGH